MKKRSLLTIIVLLASALLAQNTIVTFYIEEQVQQPSDYVQISATIKAAGDSLEDAIQQAANLIKNIDQKVKVYCSSYNFDKKQCQNLVEATPYNINPIYEIFKKKTLFGGFVVAHQVSIKVKDAENFGRLVDDLLKVGVAKINSLSWKPLVEIDVQEIAVQNGLQEAAKICAKIGMKLQKLISVMQVSELDDEHQDQQGAEEGQQQQQDQEQQEQEDIKEGISYYKFVIECLAAKKLKAESK